MERPIICVTGHRPDKLWGFDYNHPEWIKLKEWFMEYLALEDCKEAISGMALGVDMVFALAVLEMKKKGFDISLHCAIPCKGQERKWPKHSEGRILYNTILEKSDKQVIVSNLPYNAYLMDLRNQYMVKASDRVIAVWNGTKGGTYNCIEYAKEIGKLIVYYNLKR